MSHNKAVAEPKPVSPDALHDKWLEALALIAHFLLKEQPQLISLNEAF